MLDGLRQALENSRPVRTSPKLLFICTRHRQPAVVHVPLAYLPYLASSHPSQIHRSTCPGCKGPPLTEMPWAGPSWDGPRPIDTAMPDTARDKTQAGRGEDKKNLPVICEQASSRPPFQPHNLVSFLRARAPASPCRGWRGRQGGQGGDEERDTKAASMPLRGCRCRNRLLAAGQLSIRCGVDKRRCWGGALRKAS